MIKPLKLGNKTFSTNIIVGPLAGISCAPFRYMAWKYGMPAFCCTEMISAKALLYKSVLTQLRYIQKDPNEGPVSFQIFGSEPNDLGEATKIATDRGADLVDLNCGCPVKKVRKQSAGSSILTDPGRLFLQICAMKKNTHLPVSVKIRVEGNSENKFNLEIAKAVSDAGADFLVVHGRHWNEGYNKPIHYDQIKFFVDEMKIPVIGNGNVFCIESMRNMFATGCAGVMIARASIGKPWLTKQLVCEANGEIFTPPSSHEFGQIFLEHINRLAKFLGSERLAVLQARTVSRQYAQGITDRAECCKAINSCNSLDELEALVKRYWH